MTRTVLSLVALGALASMTVFGQQQPPAGQRPQPPDVNLVITGPGGPPKLAIAPFIAASSDAETIAAAKTISDVLYDDINYEREYYMIAKDAIATVPKSASIDEVPLAPWKELNADGLIVGSVQKTGSGILVRVRLIRVGSGTTVLGKEYSGSIANPRQYAHTISDEIFMQQLALRGVARTKLAFTSDRDAERMAGTEAREIKEIYFADYDGANARRVTVSKTLNVAPAWSPDGQALAYSSWRPAGQFGTFQDVIISYIYKGVRETPANGNPEKQNYLPAWSPDGTKVAFTLSQGGNQEIYVINADGTGQQKLTNESWADRPTWSRPPFNEIAYAARSGAGFDIKVYSFATGQATKITDGIGSNESPAFSPNGRHLAFVSTRNGKAQIFTIDRDGKNLRQITREGNNGYPNWSQ